MSDWVLISLWVHGWATGLFVGWAVWRRDYSVDSLKEKNHE
jgi:hypothetical protein